MSAQEAVELTAVKSVSVTLDAAELQSYLDALPRLLMEHHTLSVSGELATEVRVKDFYGPGYIQIYGGSGFTMRNVLRISNCSTIMDIHSVEFQEREGHTGSEGMLAVDHSFYVSVDNCGFTGRGASSNAAAVTASHGSRVRMSRAQISALLYSVEAFNNSYLSIDKSSAESPSTFENNLKGAFVSSGGIILLSPGIPDTLGGAANVKLGGIIAKSDGTLL